MDDLDAKLASPENEPWLKRVFRQEWPTTAAHLIAAGASIAASTGCSYAVSGCESDALISGLATISDNAAYYSVFLSQIIYRDRDKMKEESGNYSRKIMLKKAGEYASFFSIGLLVYNSLRFLGQYVLQKHSWNPATAAFTVMATATVVNSFVYPVSRYYLRQWSEKK